MQSNDTLLELFKVSAARRGARVSVALSPAKAQDFIRSLVLQKKIGIALKSTSGLSDLIGLGDCLSGSGVKVTETELVGMVAQLLRGQDVPVRQVAAMLSTATGRRVATEPKELLAAARNLMKAIYNNADLGVSEADFGIAETGEVVILESSPNARLASVLPRLHLALLDIERIVACKADIAGHVRENGSGIPGRKVPTLITHLTNHADEADSRGAGSVSQSEQHILVIRR